MYYYSKNSSDKLMSCCIELQDIFGEAISYTDITIISGYREEKEQNFLEATGKSQLRYPDSKHNTSPSDAVDVAPYPIDWKDRERATYFAGFIIGLARSRSIILRWGGDWDMDWQVRDNVFDDLWHFEIVR
jgi:peptidoglycan L-alanyl-D-glutamate endopeptidase CwlK